MLKKLSLIIALLLLANNLVAENNLKIGVILGQTGAAAKHAMFASMGLKLALNEINASGGVNGQDLELIFEDSQTQANQAVNAFNNLINLKEVDAIIGDVWEFITNPLVPMAERKQIALISPTVMPHALTVKNSYFFTLGQQINNLDSKFKLYFTKHPEVKKVALINWENDWGLGYSNKLKEVIKELNLELVEEISTIDWNNDFRSEVAKVIRKNPDLIFIPYLGERVARRLKEFNSKVRILSTANIVEALLDPSQDLKLLEGVYFVETPASEDYKKKFLEYFKEPTQFESHSSYEALHALVKAYKNNPKNIPAGLRSLKYKSTSGEIDFTKSNFGNNSKAALCRIENGKVVVVSK